MSDAHPPPRTEAELRARAEAMAGRSLGELAAGQGIPAPDDPRRAKGWSGQILESCLGASAGSLAEPDFQLIGVELKTIPVSPEGIPRESTYVTVVPLMGESASLWERSSVRLKLARVLWIPIVGERDTAIADRLVGWPLLWSPSTEEEAALRADWEELMDMVCLGELERIDARMGTWLQIRPKAADASARRWGVGETGEHIRTQPRGFYLRPAFTRRILAASYAL